MKKQRGFTAIEILICIIGLASLAGSMWLIYVAIHFIFRFW